METELNTADPVAMVVGRDDEGGPPPSRNATRWLSQRRIPLIGAAVWLATGMAYLVFWNEIAHHQATWATGGDVWGIFRAAHYIGWGDFAGVYAPGNGVVALPGMEIVLTPVAMVAGHFRLTESFGAFFLARPTAALVLMPVELLLGTSVLFAGDSLGARVGLRRARRCALCGALTLVGWPAVAVWGHAEDLVAVALLGWALVAFLDGRWTRVGWLLGFGIAFQPLVALAVPLLVVASPPARRVIVVVRAALLPAFLVGIAFLGDARDAWRQLIEQPTPPSINHATPWSLLSPVLTPSRPVATKAEAVQMIGGHVSLTQYFVHGHTVANVSGGAGRLLYVLLAFVVGVVVWRRPQSPDRILWLVAAVLAGRVFFEPVMTPYYLAPPFVLCLVMAARGPTKAFVATVVLAGELTWFAYFHLDMWVWWSVVATGTAAIIALAFPWSPLPVPRRADDHVVGVAGPAPGEATDAVSVPSQPPTPALV